LKSYAKRIGWENPQVQNLIKTLWVKDNSKKKTNINKHKKQT